jgi:DNA invertase Pin-like site-specific DNA recombinase
MRVSTDEQSLGPEAQRAAIEAWAGHAGVEIGAWYLDRGVSGVDPPADRPGLIAALSALREMRAGVLVVARRDRLARDVVIARMIARLVERSGAVIRSADGVSDGAGPEGALMRGVVDLFAEYERELIRARTKAALARKRARGESLGGKPPYGWRVGPGGRRLEADPYEQHVIRQAVLLAKRGATTRSIAFALTHAGYVNRSGHPWHHESVVRILRRAAGAPAYSGRPGGTGVVDDA